MFVTSLKWKFDADAVRGTPKTQGVFGLWDEDMIVYIGATERNVYLPDALRELLTLKRLRLHFSKYGGLPLYNQPSSALQLLRRDASPTPDLTVP
jgi:hypothetical protein